MRHVGLASLFSSLERHMELCMAKKKVASKVVAANKKRAIKKRDVSAASNDKCRCGLCGATDNLIKTMLMQRCEISAADTHELMDIVAKDLLDCDPGRFDELRTLPDPDGSEANSYNKYLLATPSDDWIASIVAVRALIELKAEEAIPLFVELLYRNGRFPRLAVGVEAQYFFASLGSIAIEPLYTAFERSGSEEDEGRCDVVAALGLIGAKHPNLQEDITNRIVTWLNQHEQLNKSSNSEIVCVLLDFKSQSTLDSIRKALDVGCLDTSVCGDWNEIKEELG